MPKTTMLALLSGAALLCTAALAGASAEPLKVVASFSIIADFAKNVGGDRVEVTTLVGPNGDAHVYEPRPADAAAVGSADIVLVNGLQLEGFVPRLVEASGAKAPVVELTQGAELLPASRDDHDHEAGAAHDHGDEAGHDHGAHDPHAWQSVRNARVYVGNVAEAFCAADAEGCQTYRVNAAAYMQKLDALEAEITAAVAAIPEARRTIITSHDAFGYLAHAYGLHFVAPEGVSTEAEASAADVARLIRQIRDDKASAVFVENITNPRLIEQIAGETGLEIGGALYSDALSEAGGPAATYIDMMRHNIATIKGAVTGS